MSYIDIHTVEQIFGANHINLGRLKLLQGEQENSATGTGQEETCNRQGGADSDISLGTPYGTRTGGDLR